MVDQNCAYCVEGELLAKFGIKICGTGWFLLFLIALPIVG